MLTDHALAFKRARPLLLATLLATLLLAGCGGGCDEEDQADLQRRNPSVDCKAQPELCQ